MYNTFRASSQYGLIRFQSGKRQRLQSGDVIQPTFISVCATRNGQSDTGIRHHSYEFVIRSISKYVFAHSKYFQYRNSLNDTVLIMYLL